MLGETFEALEPKNMTQAKHYFNLAGNLGYGDGYGRLGSFYMREGDRHRAKEAFEKGAALQSVGAMYCLGTCYYDGTYGGNADYRTAKKWFREGARLGDDPCIYFLGYMYYFGLGTTENREKAVAYFRRSATKGYAASQYSLGECYHAGKGVVQSIEQARYWWEKAAAQGYETAIDCLRELSRNR